MVESSDRFGNVFLVPALENEPLLANGYGLVTMSDGQEAFNVAAGTADWDAFDVKYPNQDADSGSPFRRRYPQNNIPVVTFSE